MTRPLYWLRVALVHFRKGENTHRAPVRPVLVLNRAADLAIRFLTFAILGFGPWWLATEIVYG